MRLLASLVRRLGRDLAQEGTVAWRRARRVTNVMIQDLTPVMIAVVMAAVAAGQTRPRLEVADPAHACPAIGGSFVAVLDESRGMLLLSAAEFPGGRVVGRGGGEGGRLSLPGGASWQLPHLAAGAGDGQIWGALYPFAAARASGCVAFDRDRFSSEGDLASYLRWLVDGVYLSLPSDERRRWPALRIADREVRLRVEGLGFQPLPLATREGASAAFRLPGVERTYLLTPFVLDEASGRVAVQVASTAEAFWTGAQKQPLGWVVASPTAAGTLADLPLTIAVEHVSTARDAAMAP
jgi:hypothetical protein